MDEKMYEVLLEIKKELQVIRNYLEPCELKAPLLKFPHRKTNNILVENDGKGKINGSDRTN